MSHDVETPRASATRRRRARQLTPVILVLAIPLLMGHTRGACGKVVIREMDQATYAKIKVGQAKGEVREIGGEADTTTEALDQGVRLECWRWDKAQGGGVYQVCFDAGNDKVVNKAEQ